MKRAMLLTTICLILGILGGCSTDVVTTPAFKAVASPSIFIGQIDCADSSAAEVIRQNINKELLKAGIQIGDANSANIHVTGSITFVNKGIVESISLRAVDQMSNVVFIATFNNDAGSNVSQVGKDFGANLAKKLRR